MVRDFFALVDFGSRVSVDIVRDREIPGAQD